MKWDDVLKEPGFDDLTNQEQGELRQHWVDTVYVPELQKAGVPEDDIPGARYEALESFDNGQGYITSFLNSGVQGALTTGTSAIQGAGVLLGSEGIEDFGTGLQQDVQDSFPVNPSLDNTNFVGNVVGNVGAFMGTAGAGGFVGKGLGAAARGAEIGGLGTGFLAGAGGAAQNADQYGIEGGDRYAAALLGGLTEVVSEKIPFLGGMGSELKAVSKIPGLSSISPKAAGGFVKAVGSETAEEVFANTAGNLVTTALAPEGVETPGMFAGTLEAAAGGAIGGGIFGGIGLLPNRSDEVAAGAETRAIAAGDTEAAAIISEANATRVPVPPTVPVQAPVIAPVPAGDASVLEDVPLVAPQDLDLAEFAAANPVTSSSDAGDELFDTKTAVLFDEDLTASTQAPVDFAETPPGEVAPLPVEPVTAPVDAELASAPLPPAPTQAEIQQKSEDIRLIDANGRVDEKMATGMFQALKDLGVTTANVVVNDTGAPDRFTGIKAKGFFNNNTVFLNRNEVTADTPLHEVTHGLIPEMRRVNPELFAQGAAILKGSPLESAIRRRYEGRVTLNEEALMEEVMVTAIANNGAEWLKAYAGNSAAIQQIKQWLAQARVWLEDFMQSKGVDPNMTVEQFANSVNRRILAGKLKPGAQDTITPAAQIARRPEAQTPFPDPIVNPRDPGFGEDVTRFNQGVADWVKSQPEKTKLVFADPSVPGETAFVSKEPGQPGKWRATQFKQTDQGQRPAGHQTFKDRETAVKSVTSRGYVPSDVRFSMAPLQPVDPESADQGTVGNRDIIGPIKFSFPAWHGTPGKITGKMSTMHVGEGEGSQAEGWGLYLADTRETGNFYRDMYEGEGPVLTDDKGQKWEGTPRQLAGSFVRVHGSVAAGLASAERELVEAKKHAESFGRTYKNVHNHWLDSVEGTEGAIAHLRSWDYATFTESQPEPKPPGNLYQVEVDLDKEDLLYWDGLQKPGVEAKLPPKLKGKKGSDLYETLSYMEGNNPEKASKKLKELGIPGIKYIDGQSRYLLGGGEPGYNYVIFDGDLIRILKENDREYGAQETKAVEDRDSEYASAVKSGDKTKQQKMVDEEFRSAGYTSTGFRGSDRPDLSQFPGRLVFVASSKKEAQRYHGSAKRVHFWEGVNPTKDPEVMERFYSDHPNFKSSEMEGSSGFATGKYPGWVAQRTLVSWLSENGIPFDSLYFVEPGGDVTVGLRDRSQIKLADRVTRDDSGRVVPLSKRGDFTTPDVRFSLGDESKTWEGKFSLASTNQKWERRAGQMEPYLKESWVKNEVPLRNLGVNGFILSDGNHAGAATNAGESKLFLNPDGLFRLAFRPLDEEKEVRFQSIVDGVVWHEMSHLAQTRVLGEWYVQGRKHGTSKEGGIFTYVEDIDLQMWNNLPGEVRSAVSAVYGRGYEPHLMGAEWFRMIMEAERGLLSEEAQPQGEPSDLEIIRDHLSSTDRTPLERDLLESATQLLNAPLRRAPSPKTEQARGLFPNTFKLVTPYGMEVEAGTRVERDAFEYMQMFAGVYANAKSALREGADRGNFPKSDEEYWVGDVLPVIERWEKSGVTRDMTPGTGAVNLPSDVRFSLQAQNSRHADLEARHNIGTITPDETAEAQALVYEAAKVTGYTVEVLHGTDTPWTVFNTNAKNQTIGGYLTKIKVGKTLFFATTGRQVAETYGGTVMRLLIKAGASHVKLDGKGLTWGYSESQIAQKFRDGAATVEINNVIDQAGVETGFPTTVFVVSDPRDIKSADPFTGTPLIERFNPESDDIRFSLQALDDEYMAAVESGDVAKQQAAVDAAAMAADITYVRKVRVSDIIHDALPGVNSPLQDGKAEPIILERTGTNNELLVLVDGYHRLEGLIKYGETEVTAIILNESDARSLDSNSSKEIDRVQELHSGESAALFTGVPLSERFNPASDSISFSIAPDNNDIRFSLAAEQSDTDRFAALLAREDAKRHASSDGSLYRVDGVQKGFDAEDNYVPLYQQVTITDPSHPADGSTMLVPLEGRETPLPKDVIEAAIAEKRNQKFSLAPQYPETDDDGFYSQMQRSLVDKLPERTTAAQVRDIVNNPQYVKPEELKWSGIIPWLEGKGKVTKAEVLEFLRGEGAARFTETLFTNTKAYDEVFSRLSGKYGGDMYLWPQEAKDEHDAASLAMGPAVYTGEMNLPKYGDYQIPGGTNYREVVVAMPEVNGSIPELPNGFEVRRATRPGATDIWEVYDNSRSESANLGGVSGGETREAAIANALRYLREDDPGRLPVAAGNYTSTHFNTPNYLAHTRLNDRTDSSGNEGTLIEELQSDRHQAGRKKGYTQDIELDKAAALDITRKYVSPNMTIPVNASVLESMGATTEELEIVRRVEDRGNFTSRDHVADAPYRKDWSLMLFKRVLRDAVASGKKWVGWTTGETQGARFDLSRQMDALVVDRMPKGGFHVRGKPKGSSNWEDFGDKGMSESKLIDTIGKDLAQKVVDQTSGEETRAEFTGAGLKTEAAGMKGFYDDILPKEIGKYVKQWKDENGDKVKVEQGDISTLSGGQKPLPFSEWKSSVVPDGSPDQIASLYQRYVESYPTEGIWKVPISPTMAESVKQGQPRYSLSAGDTMRPSGLSANQPGTPVREMTAGMVYQGESFQPVLDEATREFNKLQRDGAGYAEHLAKFNEILANPQSRYFNMTPGAYWGLVILQLNQTIKDPGADPGVVEEAQQQKEEFMQQAVEVGAGLGQRIKGFDGGLRIANDPAAQVKLTDDLVPFDGSVEKRKEFDKEKAAVTREVDKFTRDVLAETDETQLTRDIEKGLGDVARGDDASDAGEFEVDEVRLPEVDAMEQAGADSDSWLLNGIAKLNEKVREAITELIYNMQLLEALQDMDVNFSLPEGQRHPDITKALKGITSKAERDAAIKQAKLRIAALTKEITSINSVKPTRAKATAGNAQEMAVGRLKVALEALVSPKAKKKMKLTEEKIAAAITSGILSKAGLGGKLPPGSDNMVFALGLMLANRNTAASVLQNIHDIIQGDPETFGAISRDKLRAFMEVAIGRTFDTAEGASDKAPPYSEKQIASLLRSEIKRMGTSMTKVVKDAALSRTAPAELEKQLRDPKRPHTALLSQEDLDKVIGAVMIEYNRTAAERVANYKAQEARLEKLKAEREAATLEGREMRKEVNAAKKDSIDRKATFLRVRRNARTKARRDRVKEIRKARSNGQDVPEVEPLDYNEQQDLLKVEPKRVIDYIAREFGFDISGIVNMARGEDRAASLNAMVLELARTLGLSTEQTRKFMQPVIAKAMEKVDNTRKKKVEKAIADSIQKQSGRMQKKGKQPTEAVQIIRLAEKGGLDAENIEKVMLKSMNAKKFTEEFKDRLKKVIDEANDPNLPQATRDQRTAAFLGMVKSARGVYATSIWGEYMMSNIFLNVLSTLKVNAVWGFVKATADSAVYLTRFDPLNLNPEAKLPKGARKAIMKSLIRGFSRDLQYQSAYIFKTGRSKLESDYTTQFSNSDFETLAHFPETEIRLWQEGKVMSPFWASKVKLLARFSKYTRRTMVGTDIANRTPAYEMLKANAVVKLIHERSDNPPTTSAGWAKAIDDAMYGGSFELAKADAKKEVARLVASGQLDQMEAGIQFGIEMDKLLGKSLGLSDVDRVELLNQATETAKRWTVANATEGVLGGISNSLLTAVREVPGLKFLLPAIRMPIGAFSQGLDWTPLGFLRAQAIGWNQGKSASVTNYLFNRDGAKKTWNLPAGAISSELAVELRTKAMFGTAMGLGLFAMAAAAMDDDEDEADFYITGRGPEDPGRNKIWREKGNQPFMIRMNGIGSIRFQESPAFPILAALGAWSDAQRYSKPGTAESDKIFFAITRGMSAFGDAAVLKNLQDVIATSTGGSNTGSGMQKAGQVAARLAGIAVAPRIGQEVNQILYGTQDMKVGGWGAKMFANVPFTPSLFGAPALNFFGEEIHQQRGGPPGELFPMLSHRLTSPLTDDDQMLFMSRFGANQTVTSRRFKDGTRVMDDFDFVRTWQTESGKKLRAWLTPERRERFEKLRAKDVMTAEKEFDKEVLEIRTGVLRKIGKGRVDF